MKTNYKITRLFLLILLLAGLNLNIYSQTNETQPWFFIQVTDPQFGMFDQNKGFSKETELYEKTVVAINKLHPDFVLITGDMVNDRKNLSQIDEFKRITGKIEKSIPVYYSPGNHDTGIPASQEDITSYISDYGYDHISFRHKQSTIIGINSVIIKDTVKARELVQYDWLGRELSKAWNSEHIIIFTHYPFFIVAPDEADQSSNIPLKTRMTYLELFSQFKVGAVFAGHLHKNAYGKSGSTEMITTTSSGKTLGSEPSGLRVIKVYTDKIVTNFYGLEEIPAVIEY
jgi:serine/threonine-protein phosphatase CPPED1